MLERFLTKIDFSDYDDFKHNFSIKVPNNFNFAYDVVDEWAKIAPDKEALYWLSSNGGHKIATFGELKRESDRMASYFASLGIGKGDMVMLILKRRYEFWLSVLALHKLGVIIIPATHMLVDTDIIYRNNAAGVKMIITTDDDYIVEHVSRAVKESPTVKTLICCGENIPQGWHDLRKEYPKAQDFIPPARNKNEDPSLLYFTSGTTGEPKMVVHDHSYPLAHIITAKYWHNLHEDSLHLTLADTGWGKALWGKFYGQWIVGARVFVYDHDIFNHKLLLELMSKHKVTSFCAPPTVYSVIVREDLAKYDLSSLEYCTTAGEALSPLIYEKFLEGTGLKIHEAFGQTETTPIMVTFPWTEPRPGSMGMPSPVYNSDLVDNEGNSVAAGEMGEIIIRTDTVQPVGLFSGYYNDPELTKTVYDNNIYHTGDIATRDEDGYYWFVGRNDDVIKTAGYRVGPFEVESALMKHPYIVECAVTGELDPVRGQAIKATVVLAQEYKHLAGAKLVKEIQKHMRAVTATYKTPRVIEFVDELPKTISGKIKRAQIAGRGK